MDADLPSLPDDAFVSKQDIIKMSDYATKLFLFDSHREPPIRTIINTLNLPKESAGLDIGCGIGSNTLLLAEAVGKFGHILGIDLSEDLLKRNYNP